MDLTALPRCLALSRSLLYNTKTYVIVCQVSKLEQEVSGLMAQTETDELIVRKQRRTKDQQEAYDAARLVASSSHHHGRSWACRRCPLDLRLIEMGAGAGSLLTPSLRACVVQ